MMAGEGTGPPLGLEPFIHQVGGHSPLFCLDGVTVCKPWEAREHSFYSSLPPALRGFTPAYKGDMHVDIAEDREGYIILRGAPPPHYSRGQGEGFERSQPKMRLKRCGSIEIETEGVEQDRYFQDERVEEEVNPWALKCHRDNLRKVGINLTCSPELATAQRYILLENLTTGISRPCVLDLKVGTRQHGDSATASKRQSKSAKVASTTSGTLGLRLGGMQVYQANIGRYICRSKTYGRGLTTAGLRSALRQFFSDGLTIRSDVIRALLQRLSQLRDLLASLDSYRFYTSSLLITYDGGVREGTSQPDPVVCRNSLSTSSLSLLSGGSSAPPRARHTSAHSLRFSATSSDSLGAGPHKRKRSVSCSQAGTRKEDLVKWERSTQCVDVRLIDFAHSTHRGLQDAVEHEGPDQGFLYGLENLASILEAILNPRQEGDVNS